MSVSRTAVRMSAVRAITGRTLAGDRVSDSTIAPIDLAIQETKLPMITVTTDDDVATVQGRDIAGADRQLELVIEMAVASKVVIDGAVTFEIPETDFGLEWTLDALEQQVDRALLDEGTPWSQVFMLLVPRILRKTSRRAANALQGVRYAARQVIYQVDCIGSPQSGAAVDPETPFGKFLALLEADVETGTYGAFLRSTVESDDMDEWRRQARMIGVLEDSAMAVGLGPEGVGEEATIAGDYLNLLVIIRGMRMALAMPGVLACTATRFTP